MVELLAVITILGIVSALAIVGISKLLENAKKEYYKATEKEVKVAAKSYIQNNRKYLPKSIGSKTTITLKTLQDNNYIKGVKDYSKQSCDTEKTYVQIFKYGQNKYTYTTYLECPNYNSRKVVKEEYTPAIDIKFIKTQQDSEEQMNDIKVAKAEITIKGSSDANLKLLSYNYIVYKDGSEVISSGSIEANYKEKITIKLDLNKYTPGTIKIKVGATNINGFSQTETKSTDYADTQPPTCIIKDEDKQENPKPWINQARKITVGCDDGNGSGCTRSEYTKTFNNSTNIGIITIKDEAGNTTNCKVSVNVDKAKPTITIKAYQRTSTGGKTGSAVATVKVNNKTSTATMDTYSNTTNKWLNKADYPYGVYYEVTYSDNLALATRQWNYNALNLTSSDPKVNTITSGQGAVSISGTSGSQDVSLSGEGYRKAYYEVKDQAGNTSRINITAPIDRTAPVSPSINMYKWASNGTRPTSPTGLTIYENNTWSNKSVYTTASGSTDTTSGLDTYQYTTTGATANDTSKTGQTRSIEAEGTSTIKYRACDKAGNCSAYTAAKTIKLDKTAPTTPTVNMYKWTNNSTRPTSTSGLTSYTNNTWSNRNVYTTASGSTDTISGLDTYQYTTTGTTANDTNKPGQTRSIEAEGTSTIKYRACDKAGNCSAYTTAKIIKLDKTAPTIPTISMYKWTNNNTIPTATSGLTAYANNTWSTINVYTTANGSTDTISGLDTYQYTTTGATVNDTNKLGQTRNIKAEGTSTIKYRACDNAGNCSAYTTASTIKIDKTAPTCGSNNGSAAWTNANRTVTVNCSDSGSGCTQSTFSQTYSSDTKTSSITIQDNIGNTTICPVNVYVDKTKPTIKITAYKRTSSGGKTGGSIASKTVNNTTSLGTINQYSNNTNGWLNNDNYPYGVYYEITYSDNFALSKRQWAYNLAGSKSASNATEGNGEITISGTTGSHNVSLSAEGYRNAYLKVVDGAGNISKIDIIAPIDRTPPYTVTVNTALTIQNMHPNSAFTIKDDNNKYCSYSNIPGMGCQTCSNYDTSIKKGSAAAYDQIDYEMYTFDDKIFTIYLHNEDEISGTDNNHLQLQYCYKDGCWGEWTTYPATEYRQEIADKNRTVYSIHYRSSDLAGNISSLTTLKGTNGKGNVITLPASNYNQSMCHN